MDDEMVRLNEEMLSTWWRVNRFLNTEFEGPKAVDTLTGGQLRMMRALTDGLLSMSGLAGIAGVTRGTATGMVDRLLARGFVERFEDPTNRRQILVKITPKGHKFFAKMHERAIQRADMLTRHLPSEDRKDLRRLLHILAMAVDKR